MKHTYKLSALWICLFLICFVVVPILLWEISLLWTIIPVVLLLIGFSRLNWHHFPVKLFLVAFLARLMVIFCIETLPESDFEFQLLAAQKLINGDTSFLHEQLLTMEYFQMWPYHLGIVALDAFFLSIWNSVFMLQLVNCLAGSLTVVLIYLIACEVTEERSARIAALLYCFFPFTLTYVTVLTNQFSATLLTLFGVYLIVSSKIKIADTAKFGLLGLILAVANAIRPESIIPLFAIGLSLVLCVNKTNVKTQIIHIAIMLAAYFAVQFLINQAFILSGLTQNGLINTNPYWKIAVGLNVETAGGWSESDYLLAADPEACIALIKERIQQPISTLLHLMIDKIKSVWVGGELFWAWHHSVETGMSVFGRTLNVAKLYEFLTAFNKGCTLIIYALLLIGIFRLVKSRRIEFKHVLLVNQVFVPLGVFLLVEAQARYIHSFQVYIFVLAATGITCFFHRNTQEEAQERIDPQ